MNNLWKWRLVLAFVSILTALSLWLGTVRGEQASVHPLREGTAPEAGMDGQHLTALDGDLQAATGRVFPGGAFLAAKDGIIVKEEAFGDAVRFGPDKEPLQRPIPAGKETVYDLASLTKLFTAVSVMQLAERDRVDLDEPVARYLPRFAAKGKTDITVRQLLTHTGGLPPWMPLDEKGDNRAERLRAVMEAEPQSPPGERLVYSDLDFIVLGELVERVSGQPLHGYMEKNLFRPLRMDSARFNPPDSWKHRTAATEVMERPRRGLVWGVVHDENAWALGGVAGHAGLFADLRDTARFGQTLLNGGILDGRRILQPSTVEEMWELQEEDREGKGQGLGWEIDRPSFMGELSDSSAVGHTGFSGTSIVLDRERNLMVILLTNRIHPDRDGPPIDPVRRRAADAVAAALHE